MRFSKLLKAGASLLSLAIITPASAASDEETASRGDEIVVTGRAGKGSLTKAEASYAISTIDRDALRLAAPISTAETFKNIPGFWVEASGGEASNNVRTRGIPTDGYSSVTIQEDGLTIQHDGGLGWLNADQSFRVDETIGRVEAVRGGPASIFASNSPGGVVNFITRQAGDKAEGLLKAEIGDYGLLRTDFWFGAPIGDGWGLAVGGFFRSDKGVREPGFTPNEGGQIRVGVSRDFERGRVEFNIKHLDDKVGFLLPVPLTFDPSGKVKAVPGFDANYGTLAGPDNRLLSFRNVNGPFAFDLGRGTDVSLTQATLKARFDLGGGWEAQNIARYRDSDIVRNGLFPTGNVERAAAFITANRAAALAAFPGATDIVLRYATDGSSFNPAAQNGNGLVVRGNLLSVSVPYKEFTNDFRLVKTFEIAGQHDIALGGYFSNYSYDYDRFMATSLLDVRDQARRLDVLAVNAAGATVGRVTDNGILRYGSLFDNAAIDARVYAVYASDEWQITDKLRLDAGVRYERIGFTGSVEGKRNANLGDATTLADDQVITGAGAFQPIDRKYAGTSWTVGLNYQFRDALGAFVRYTDTVRLPSPSEFQGSTADALRTDIVKTPVTMVEAGVKFASDTASLFVTGFYSVFDNVRFTDNVFNSVTNSFTTRVGYAGTKTVGIEAEGYIRPVSFFDLSAAVSWQNPEYKNFTFTNNVGGIPQVVSFNGNQLIRVPKFQARFVPGVNLLGDRVRIQAPIEYYSARYADAANSVRLPAFYTLNADVRIGVTDRLAIGMNAVNLTNTIGLTEGNPRAGQFIAGDAGAEFFLARPILGRSFRVNAVYNF